MSERTEINLVSIVGDGICVSPDDGEKIFQAIRLALEEGKAVEISFEGVEDLTSLFLNTAIGQLYGEFDEEFLKSRLSVINAADADLVTLKRSVDRAKEYYKDPERFHSVMNEELGHDE